MNNNNSIYIKSYKDAMDIILNLPRHVSIMDDKVYIDDDLSDALAIALSSLEFANTLQERMYKELDFDESSYN